MSYLAVTQSDGLELLCQRGPFWSTENPSPRFLRQLSDPHSDRGLQRAVYVSLVLFQQVDNNLQEFKRVKACRARLRGPPEYLVLA